MNRDQATAVLGYSHGGAVAQQLALDDPARCSRLVLACTYAFNMARFREKLEGHLVPVLIRVLGMRRFAKLVIRRGLEHVGEHRADWIAGLIANQDGRLIVSAWKEAMAFDSRRRLEKIKCPTLVVAAANDHAIPIHHAKQLHDGITGSRLVIVDGADHTLVWTHPGELARLLTNDFLAA